jgi:hypothetical protein
MGDLSSEETEVEEGISIRCFEEEVSPEVRPYNNFRDDELKSALISDYMIIGTLGRPIDAMSLRRWDRSHDYC